MGRTARILLGAAAMGLAFQRKDTTDGKAAAVPCGVAGTKASVSYTANYSFFAAHGGRGDVREGAPASGRKPRPGS